MTAADTGPHGVLPIDKPVGPTSHDIVAAARRALRTRRIGHTGTLDPFASGLLLLCVGQATRIAEYITGLDKRYTALVRLGVVTDTDDSTGAIISESDAAHVTCAEVDAVLPGLRGRIEQVPPQYSAKKIAGERAYVLARAGHVAELSAVPVTVHEITITDFDAPFVSLEIACSSGTYIRALARDLGVALGTGAHLSALRRTAVGERTLHDAVDLASLQNDPVTGLHNLIPILHALQGMPRIDISQEDVVHIRHGRAVGGAGEHQGAMVVTADGELIAIAEAGDGWLRPKKVFA